MIILDEALKRKLEIIEKACDDKRAEEFVAIDISNRTPLADYFVIASGNSAPQLDAIVDEIDFKMSKEGFEPYSKEGSSDSGWLILDYEDIIVHIFHVEKRKYYDIERLWIEFQGKNEGK